MSKGGDQLSAGAVWAGDYRTKYGQVVKAVTFPIARSTAPGTVLGQLPAGATILRASFVGQTGSNAGTSAVISAGYQGGTGTELINAASVLGAAGVGVHDGTPGVANLAATQQVTGGYTESGTASTAGGPWNVVIEFVTNV
ncbi:MAG: hypothetical protein LC754_06145 [Acidobacteria bacterium]|nr:hypothetical protein [Acidobacteriota bacterium]